MKMLLRPTISTTYIWMNRPIGQISRNLGLELFSAYSIVGCWCTQSLCFTLLDGDGEWVRLLKPSYLRNTIHHFRRLLRRRNILLAFSGPSYTSCTFSFEWQNAYSTHTKEMWGKRKKENKFSRFRNGFPAAYEKFSLSSASTAVSQTPNLVSCP